MARAWLLPCAGASLGWGPAAASSTCILARFQELLERPANDGYAADEPGMSVGDLADRQGAETDDVLLPVFR